MIRTTVYALIGLAAFCGFARAEAPASLPVQGYLTNADGQALDGTFSVRFRLYDRDSPTGAASEVLFEEIQDLKVEKGSFLAYLGDKELLPTELFKQKPIIYVGIRIDTDDELKPLLQLGTAPYAAFANACGDSDTVGGKSVDQIVATAREGIASSGGMGATGAPKDPAPLSYRFISTLTKDCVYDLDTNATLCKCGSGEIAIAAGGWAGRDAATGRDGVISASRHPLFPEWPGSPEERARDWTISCLKYDGSKTECTGVQVLCLKI